MGFESELRRTRERTLELVADLPDDVLHRPLDPLLSPLVWDLGHIAAYEDLWCVHRLGGEPLLRPETMRQALFLGGLPGGHPTAEPAFAAEPDWLEVPAGPVDVGAAGDGF